MGLFCNTGQTPAENGGSNPGPMPPSYGCECGGSKPVPFINSRFSLKKNGTAGTTPFIAIPENKSRTGWRIFNDKAGGAGARLRFADNAESLANVVGQTQGSSFVLNADEGYEFTGRAEDCYKGDVWAVWETANLGQLGCTEFFRDTSKE